MAIYHFRVKFIGRSTACSAVGAAAYRSALRLHDFRQDLSFDHTNKPNVVHSEVLAPEGTSQRLYNRELLWNAVEAREKRRDARLAREVEFALPQELHQSESIALAREFVQDAFVARGMIADLNVHWDQGYPHAHVMLTTRELSPDGFGNKARQWDKVELLREWREHWADLANQHLLRAGIDARIDHRSYRDQGVELEPNSQLGRAVVEMRWRGQRPELLRHFEAVRERNAQRIEQRPEIVFDSLTRRQSTFTHTDMGREVARYVDHGKRFEELMARLEQSPELVTLVSETTLGDDVGEPACYTTCAMVRLEQRIAEVAFKMAVSDCHSVGKAAFAAAAFEVHGLSQELREAVLHIISSRGIAVLARGVGAETSTVLAAGKEAWEVSGYRVRGAAPSSIAAENLGRAPGMEAKTLASWELAWKSREHSISGRDVFVIDEAGMVGSRQLARVLLKLQEAGAKAVLICDAEQLQPIEAGAALRAVAEQTGFHELTSLRRAHSWQREASRDFARGDAAKALDRYRQHDALRFAETRREAKNELLRDWADFRVAHGAGESTIILAPDLADASELNRRARDVRKESGELASQVKVEIWREVTREDGSAAAERGEQSFALGDRVRFRKNDRELGLKAGMLGTVTEVGRHSMRVALDGREHEVTFKPRDYGAIEYGYAAAVGALRGASVDRAFVLATPGMNRHLAQAGLTCHREAATLYAGHDDFKDFAALIGRLSRTPPTDSRLDYAARRGLEPALCDHAQLQKLTQAPKPARESDHGPIERFKNAHQEFIRVLAGNDYPDVKVRARELRQEMGQAAWEIAMDRRRLSEADDAGFAREVKSLARWIERERGRRRENDLDLER